MRYPPSVTRGWRAMSLGVALLLPVVWAPTIFIHSLYPTTTMAFIPEEVRVVAALVRALDEDASGRKRLPAADREAIEGALATRYRAALASAHSVSDPLMSLGMTPQRLRLAEERIERRLASASAVTSPRNTALETLIEQAGVPSSTIPWYLKTDDRVMTLMLALMYVACFAHINALVWRGGVIRMLGLEFVTADGQPASRLRVLSRTAATWVPLMIVAPASSPAHWLSYLCLLLLFAGAVIAILSPERGIQDRLAGTWIVPR